MRYQALSAFAHSRNRQMSPKCLHARLARRSWCILGSLCLFNTVRNELPNKEKSEWRYTIETPVINKIIYPFAYLRTMSPRCLSRQFIMENKQEETKRPAS